MIFESKVILFATEEDILRVIFLNMSRYGIMATQLLATLTTVHHHLQRENCCLPSEPSSSATPPSYGCVLRISAHEMFLCLIS